MRVPFTKAHGAQNDFLLTWEHDVPGGDARLDRAAFARAICDRHAGVGADGWIIVGPPDPAADGAIALYNSDGSTAEISGNGTRCAAAFLIAAGRATDGVRIRTGAGLKTLRLLRCAGLEFEFDMEMGPVEVVAERFSLPLSGGPRDVTLLRVGNPQCALPVSDFDFDWRAMGAEIERHPHFPGRTNVSFVRPAGEHAIDVRFWERGAGETMSSGTGSTGAAAMAVLRGLARSPVTVKTPAGPLEVRIGETAWLTGPAVLVAEGEFLT
jgi:diaminopimelate epimerase